jgi:hypothetical protein
MLVEDRIRPEVEELEQTIERQVALRTWGRVRSLRVEVEDGRVVVTGRAPSYYVKQLVLLAVREVVGMAPIELNIEVVRPHTYRAAAAGT